MPSRPTCEFCNAAAAVDTHHTAQGKDRAACDEHEELKLSLCRDCHNVIGEQRAKREIGLALLVIREGRSESTLRRIVKLFWDVTQRQHYPELWRVRKWVERLDNTRS